MKRWTIILIASLAAVLVGTGVFVFVRFQQKDADATSFPLHALNVTTKNVSVDTPPKKSEVRSLDQKVPFTSQAPLGEWSDSRQQDGCEEASALMAVLWARGEKISSPKETLQTLHAITNYEQEHYGSYHDTDPVATVDRIFHGYFTFTDARVGESITKQDIIAALMQDKIVITPMDGQKLGNTFYTQPGPARHMLIIRGYDLVKKQFITNDPGTRHGEAYRYDEDVFFQAIRVYPTGDHAPIVGTKKSMIIVGKTK